MHLRNITAAAFAAATALTLAACGGETPAEGDGGDPVAEVSGGHDPTEGTSSTRPSPNRTSCSPTPTARPTTSRRDGGARHPALLRLHPLPRHLPAHHEQHRRPTAGLTEEQRQDLRVVFVTTDPERDTPESLGEWLRMQDPDFTGLTGDFDDIQAAARSLGVSIEPSYEDEKGDIVSTHGTQVVAFLPDDDKAHVIYTEGATAETFERDIPKLLRGELP